MSISSALEARMRDLLAQASVLSDVASSRIDAEKTSGSKAGTVAPKGPATSLYDHCATLFAEAETDRDKEAAIRWAEGAIGETRKRQEPPRPVKESDAAKAYWVLEDGRGKDYRRVAADLGMDPLSVYQMRTARGLDGRLGVRELRRRGRKAA